MPTLQDLAIAAAKEWKEKKLQDQEAESAESFEKAKGPLLDKLRMLLGERFDASSVTFERVDDIYSRYRIEQTNAIAWLDGIAFCYGKNYEQGWGFFAGLEACDRNHLTWRAVWSLVDLGDALVTSRCDVCDREQRASEAKYSAPTLSSTDRLAEVIREIAMEAALEVAS